MPVGQRKAIDEATCGGRLRAALRDSGMSHQRLAKRIGVSQALVTAWCNETRAISVQSAFKAAQALGGIDPATICDDWAFVVERGAVTPRIDPASAAAALRLVSLSALAAGDPPPAVPQCAVQLSRALTFVLERGLGDVSAADLAAYQASQRSR